MKQPVVLNIDSQYDWSAEVRSLWDNIDWELIRDKTGFPLFGEIKKALWDERRNQIVLIGLCSSLLIEKAYNSWDMSEVDVNHIDDSNRNIERAHMDSFILDYWRDRQRRKFRYLLSIYW